MEGKFNINNYRSKLDKTLASPDLANDEIVQALVKKQLLQSSNTQFEGFIENAVERRSKEVSGFLSMLRSASVNDVERSKLNEDPNRVWKVKQDTEEFRVMYREGPEGTPYHSLLAEGYVDGPLDVCLCISWETSLYQKWWPQTLVPNFKVVSSQCLQRVRTGEQISLVRMKVSWPLSSREALIHYFAFEYFKDGLIVVLLNTISDLESIDLSTHGFSRDGIPDANDVVRIDVVGGFALQKVSADRSFFRTIANMDIKLDFVPPPFINFISRQLVGSGFKLYKKEVALVSKGDEKFREALKDPLYARIREALYSENVSMDKSRDLEIREVLENNDKENNRFDDSVVDLEVEDVMIRDRNEPVMEIEEFKEENTEICRPLDDDPVRSSDFLNDQNKEKLEADDVEVDIKTEGVQVQSLRTMNQSIENDVKKNIVISPKVKQALETLEKAISMFQEYRGNKENIRNSDKAPGEESIMSEDARTSEKNDDFAESSKIESTEVNSDEPNSMDNYASRHKGSNSYIRETNQSKIVPASPDEGRSSPSNSKHVIVLHSSMKITENPSTVEANNVNGNRVTQRKNKKTRFCFVSR